MTQVATGCQSARGSAPATLDSERIAKWRRFVLRFGWCHWTAGTLVTLSFGPTLVHVIEQSLAIAELGGFEHLAWCAWSQTSRQYRWTCWELAVERTDPHEAGQSD